jgi:hypothetical protein
MCIDYWMLDKATQKDHFPLPFINEMLERLAKHSFFCYLHLSLQHVRLQANVCLVFAMHLLHFKGL